MDSFMCGREQSVLQQVINSCNRVLSWLNVCGTSPRSISTSRLGITAVHLWPINPVFCWGPYLLM